MAQSEVVPEFSADEIEAVRLSLCVAFWAMLGSLPLGIATAIVLARGLFWGKAWSTASSICRLSSRGYLLLLSGRRFAPDTAGSIGLDDVVELLGIGRLR